MQQGINGAGSQKCQVGACKQDDGEREVPRLPRQQMGDALFLKLREWHGTPTYHRVIAERESNATAVTTSA